MRSATEGERILALSLLARHGFPEPGNGWSEPALCAIAARGGWIVETMRDQECRWVVSVIIPADGYREISAHPDRLLATLIAVASMVAAYPPCPHCPFPAGDFA
jgi:hypothetical protein